MKDHRYEPIKNGVFSNVKKEPIEKGHAGHRELKFSREL